MVGQSRKWMMLIATTWVQAFTGTNFDFSSYSSTLKTVLGISQVQLNYLSVASDMGKAFGWCSGVSLMYLPLWVVMFMAAFLGLLGYGVQWFVIKQVITLPYFLVFLLCLVAGCSICWFNTVCFVLCIRNFANSRALALSLTISFNGLLSTDAVSQDSFIFIILNVLAVITGLYLLLLNSLSSEASRARILLVGALILLLLPLCLPGIVCGRNWARHNIHTSFCLDGSTFSLVDPDDLELHKELLGSDYNNSLSVSNSFCVTNREGFFKKVMEKGRLTVLGEEHPARLLVHRWDFWLYYLAYFCGGTIGLVYSNNLGQIAQSRGFYSQISTVVTLYSSFSFFGRLLSAAPDFLRDKVYFARTGWLAVALVPTPIAFFLLAASGSEVALHAGTAMIGLSSGFVFSAAVSITSELFGPNSASVNHNILITNIPIGSLLYGLLAALVYDSNVKSYSQENSLGEAMVCMGRDCYQKTFIYWGCISLLGLISSFLLFLRTKPAYDHLERNRSRAQYS
ncbi:PREDICTED: protein NUCLEAR FUSION DEFECTIVE 4 isoform X2 [Theobroma cacao]|uniref:Protein NUCLEAR FUSION DEFECTIVE 4 isoform X2 n=1 Tax=Theobroma cacao TaxID=3641 RepID=A0AB32WIP5_THECC|nr:PREDICTED: protein NUCLEAR FUSION DEFECTIVE 4 isoform X2 [Theobroma cacao]